MYIGLIYNIMLYIQHKWKFTSEIALEIFLIFIIYLIYTPKQLYINSVAFKSDVHFQWVNLNSYALRNLI